jgi:hypothetical protein
MPDEQKYQPGIEMEIVFLTINATAQNNGNARKKVSRFQ